MPWNVIFYETASGTKPVAKFLRRIPVQAKAKCMKYISMLEEYGYSLPTSYREKVRDNVWALRPEYGGNEYRIFFFFDDGAGEFVVVHAILKNQRRLSENDISTASGRIDEYLARRLKVKKEKQ